MAQYNIVRDYDWTSAPKGSSFRKTAPRVWLKSYKIDSNQIMSAIQGYVALVEGGTTDAQSYYDKMYSESTTPEDDFWFPFFGSNVRGFTNTFGDTFQSGVGGAGGILSDQNEQLKTLAGGLGQAYTAIQSIATKTSNPGTYIETPMFYQFEKNDSPLDVSMVLSNTINENSYKDNLKLVQYFTRINRPLRKNSIAVDPPRIYKIRLHGIRYIRWAYCSNFNVELLGTKREIDKTIIPEAYQLNMTFQSLTLEHAGFLDYTTR